MDIYPPYPRRGVSRPPKGEEYMKKLIASAAILAIAIVPLAATADDDDEAMDGR